MKVNERIKSRRVELGMSVDQLAEKLSINRATIYRYESEDISKLPASILQPLAAALRTTPYFLMGWEETETLNNPADKAGKKAVAIPVLGSIPAGIPIEAIQDILDWEEITGDMAKTGEYFALRIKGDSMEPKISDGDVVIIRRQEQVDNGEIAVVMINGDDATIKKFFKNETGVTLIGTNPSFSPLTFTPHQLRHTYATMLYQSGVDVLTAKELLGHADIKTTLNIYTHLDGVYKKKTIGKLNDYLAPKKEKKTVSGDE